MAWLGTLFGGLVVLALTNVDILKLCFHLTWPAFWAVLAVLLLGFGVLSLAPNWKRPNFTRLGVMLGGATLIEICVAVFTLDLALALFYGTVLLPRLSVTPSLWGVLLHILLVLLPLGLLAWNGIVRMYLSSVQLGIKWRVLFLLFWWVPIVDLVLLRKLCWIVRDEYDFETEKQRQNQIRSLNETCRTQYPIVLVHGVFFRDRKCFNYWGRIPGDLQTNGAVLYYGEQQSAARTADAAAELRDRVLQIVEQTGCEKVNIIAHSKGGLESRYAISHLGLAPYVASLTTINTPHRGCAFVDWLLEKMPPWFCNGLAKRYNGVMRRLGDTNPDFYAAVCDLTSRRCEELNRETPDQPGVYYQSVGSKMRGFGSAPFPQNVCYLLVRCFDRENDGLVGVESMRWGSQFRMVSAPGYRGIAHGDVIDLNRQNIPGFDVREFYVELVQDLKAKGF